MATAGVRNIVLRFAGDTKQLESASKKGAGSLKKFESGVNKASAVIVGAAVSAGAGLVKLGGDFDDAFDSIHTATGSIGSDMDALKEDFKAAFAQVPNDMPTVADALGQLNTLTGATGKELQDMTVSVTEAARLLGGDASDAAAKFGGLMKLWQVDAKDGPALMDSLFAATQKYNVSLGSVTGALEKYGPVLKNTGFSLHETIGFMGQLEAAGIQIGRVMPGINAATRKWASEGVTDMRGALIEAGAAIRDAESDVEGLNIASEVFGAQGAQRLAAAIRSGALDLENLADGIEGMDGLIATTADETNDWAEKLQLLKNEGMVAIEPIASKVFDLMGDGIDKFKALTEWGKKNTGTVKALAIALGVIAGTILAVNVGLKVYHGIMMVVRAATLIWTGIQWALNAAFLANPLTWIILAIVALIAVIVLIATKTTWFQTAWEVMSKAVVAYVQTIWRFIKEVLWEKGIKRYFELIGAIITWVVQRFQSGFARAKTAGSNVLDFIRSIPGRIKDAFSKVGEFITAPFRAGFAAVKTAWNNLVGGKGFDIPSWVPGVGGKSFRFPRFHAGGTIPGPLGREVPILATAGERILSREQAGGPEEFTATVPIDLGEGITRVFEIKLQRRDRGVVRRSLAGAGRAV